MDYNMNEDLVNDLIVCDYIRSEHVERAFHLVNRCNYISSSYCGYFKSAWRRGKLHLSAASIYGVVMEELELKSGLSFLNIGSGTGYLSTMVGLILGPFGINHGIEIYDEVVEYANKKLDEFKNSLVADIYEFAEPKFMQGNGLCLPPELPGYDRIYVGAGCKREYRDYLKRLLNVGGILIVPIESTLFKIRRKSQNHWKREQFLMCVTFANIVSPTNDNKTLNTAPFTRNPLRLDELCRITIKNILRTDIGKITKDLNEYIKEKQKVSNFDVSSDSSDACDKSDDEYQSLTSKLRMGISSMKRTIEEVNLGDLGDTFLSLMRARRRRSNESDESDDELPIAERTPSPVPSVSPPLLRFSSSSSSSSESLKNFDINYMGSESSLSLSSQSDVEMSSLQKNFLFDDPNNSQHILESYLESYAVQLMARIEKLPLPEPLKKFINNNKPIELKSQD